MHGSGIAKKGTDNIKNLFIKYAGEVSMRKGDYEEIVRHALENGQIIIYGAHLVAKELYLYIKNLEKRFDFLGFAVTSTDDNPSILENERVFGISSYQDKKEAYVLIAMPEKYHKEVEEYLKSNGFFNYGAIGIRGISCLLGEAIVKENHVNGGKYLLQESKNDYSWLDLYEKEESGDIRSIRHYKFPIMTRFSREESFKCLNRFCFKEDYENALGKYRNIHTLPSSGRDSQIRESLDMYMVTSHRDSKENKQYVIPGWTHSIQAGTALAECHTSEFLDNRGDNISDKNVSYAEMTAMYWIWKNSRPSKYKGLCHYRRHFDIDDKSFTGIVENGIDVVLSTPRLVLNGVRSMFMQDTPVKESVFQNMMDSIKEVWGEEVWKEAAQYFDGILYYPNNMLVAKEHIFNEYCAWVFPVLFRMEEHDRIQGVVKKDRHIAFSAELLTSFYFVRNRDHYRIAVTDYIFLDGK